MKKRIISLLLSVTMVLLCGCGSSGKSAEPSTKSSDSGKDTLVVAVAADSGDLNPHGNYSTSLARIKAQVYEGLFFLTYENELKPWLAKSYEWIDDVTVQIKLREGVQFHCGGEMKAEDVLFSLKTVSESAQSQVVEKIDFDKSSVVDDYTVELVCKTPYSPLLTNLSYLPAAIFSKEGYEAANGDWTESIGTGPYVWGDWITGSSQKLVAFDDYWGDTAKIKNIEFKVIAEATNRVIELETGTCDLTYDVAATDIDRIENAEDLEMARYSSNDIIILGFNNEVEPLNNPLVRRAIAMAVDRNTVWEIAYEGTGSIASGFIEESVPGYADVNLPEYDPEGAKKLLAEAGYPDGFETSVVTNTSTERMAIAEYLQNALAEIGITLEINAMDVATVSDTLKVARTHELYTFSVWPATGDIDYALRTFHSQTSQSLNISGYKNPEYDAIIDAASAELDDEERLDLDRQAQEILAEDMPVIPLIVRERLYAHKSNVKGFSDGSSQTPILNTLYFE